MLHKSLSQLDKFLYEHKLVYFLCLYKKYHPETSQDDIFIRVYTVYKHKCI